MSVVTVRDSETRKGRRTFEVSRMNQTVAPSAILMLAIVAGLLARGSALLNDPDTQWHIAIGRWIWTAGRVPSTDLFSHTFEGAPWIAKEWVSQLLLYATYQVGGWTAVVVLAALAIALSFAMLDAWLRRRIDPTLALAATLVAIILALPHFLARPHILVLPIIVLWMTSLVSSLERDSTPPLRLASLMVFWVNMHGSFPLGLVMAGVLAGEGIVAAGHGARLARLRQWSLFLAVALAATMLSPYGWNALLVPLHMAGNAATLSHVNEWQPLALDLNGGIALVLLALIAAVLLRNPQTNAFRILAAALLAYLMIRHARFISLFGIIAPILAARAIAEARLQRKTAVVAPSGAAQRPGPIVTSCILVALIASAVGLIVVTRPSPSSAMTPDAAFQAAQANGVSGPVYNDYDFGGYLIAHGVKTFVDGRTDQLFLGDFLPDLAATLAATSDEPFAAMLKHYRITWALVRARSDEARHFAHMPGWRKIHDDPVAAVYVAAP